VPAAGASLGVPLYVQSLSLDYLLPALIVQLVFIATTIIFLVGYRLCRGNIVRGWCPFVVEPLYHKIGSQLKIAGWGLCALDIIRLLVGWATGGLDRGYAGEVVLQQQLGLWTFAGIFGRFNNLWFFLLPVMWRESGRTGRLIIYLALGVYGIVAFASGSRGLMIHPLIIGFVGYYFFTDHPNIRPEKWFPVIAIVVGAYIYFLDVYRNTEAFNNSRLLDISGRLAAAQQISQAAKDRSDFAFTIGRALIGTADDVIFEGTPSGGPYAGVSDIWNAIKWTWVPQKIAPDKPTLWDANEIVVSYTNNRQERSFASISLGADLYRRLGWSGFAIGVLIFGGIYGLAIRVIIRTFSHWNLFLGVLLIAFLVAGLQAGFSSSVLQTWWIWAYDFPKHLVPLVIYAYVIRTATAL
jgi:hypothetical protein